VTIAFYPNRLVIAVLFLVIFGCMVGAATDLRGGLAVGVLALLAYLFVEVCVTFNPPTWWRDRPGHRPD